MLPYIKGNIWEMQLNRKTFENVATKKLGKILLKNFFGKMLLLKKLLLSMRILEKCCYKKMFKKIS